MCGKLTNAEGCEWHPLPLQRMLTAQDTICTSCMCVDFFIKGMKFSCLFFSSAMIKIGMG